MRTFQARPRMIVPGECIDRLRRAVQALRVGRRKWPPAMNETKELDRAVLQLLRLARSCKAEEI